MFTFNNTVTITRGASYSTTVIASLQVYIYEPTEEQDAINGVDGGQIEDRMITIYSWLKEGDKVTTVWWVVYIIKRVKNRKSIVTNHFEILLRKQND